MIYKIIAKQAIEDLFKGLQENYDEVAGPRACGPAFVFDKLQHACELRLDYESTILPPTKYFLAPTERLMRFNRVTGESYDSEPVQTSRAIIGMHPCDINAVLLLDEIFLGDFIDPHYAAARKSTFIIGTSCMPTVGHICNAFGTDEIHRGFDLFLTDLDDRYLLSCRSVPALELVDKYLAASDPTAKDIDDFQERTKRFKDAFTFTPNMDQLPLLYGAKYNDEQLWKDVGDDCLCCGACAAVCPVCYCFDVCDKLDASGQTGLRYRSWDSCLKSEFAEVAHNHNFRPTRASRVRYRFYHKFVGNFSRQGKMLCVGCGRCMRACKVNITPARIIGALQQSQIDKEDATGDGIEKADDAE
ncbi:MAG: 4Fe-4S dicluster domain-containing protein [Coriobacteriia bacterium]|nr:4Fe-4S dicluster domain-containing protein [Coriobacteriia bacterium]MCL2745777.1 4Fe-4S dicluster domain-containing protein [Coriobacteriia bacterium]MCL2870270.1 4Fe-4S dicluster domain-containing protein [Coriobacteriia bacterium]